MRFKKPDDGDVRIKEKFLLFPLMINRETRWLEFAKWQQEYYIRHSIFGGIFKEGWKDVKWID